MRNSLPIVAGRFERFLANVIDSLLANILAMVIFSASAGSDLALLAGFLISAAYYIGFTSSGWQATPGKRLLNIYVMQTHGGALNQKKAAERFLAFTIPSLPLYASFFSEQMATTLFIWLNLIWFSPILYTNLRLGLHDRLCGTRVVIGRK